MERLPADAGLEAGSTIGQAVGSSQGLTYKQPYTRTDTQWIFCNLNCLSVSNAGPLTVDGRPSLCAYEAENVQYARLISGYRGLCLYI